MSEEAKSTKKRKGATKAKTKSQKSKFVCSNLVIEAMGLAIGEILPEAQVFADRAPQGVDKGAFILRQTGQLVDDAFGLVELNDGVSPRRQLRRPSFEVFYYPVSDEGKRDSECHDVEELLFFALEQITTRENIPLTADGMRSATVDGTLMMTMEYPYIIEDTRHVRRMEHLEFNARDGASVMTVEYPYPATQEETQKPQGKRPKKPQE